MLFEGRKTSLFGFIWSAVERYSSQLLQFVFFVILARLIAPESFGILSIMMFFVLLLQEIINGGFHQALVRKQDRTSEDISTTLVYNVISGILCYVILFVLSPAISDFFCQEDICNCLRILGVSLIFHSLTVVPIALLTAEVDFRSQAMATAVAVVVSGVISILLAYNNYGLLALVIQNVVLNFVKVIVLWMSLKVRVGLRFFMTSFKNLFNYGYKVLLYGVVDIVATQLTSVIIGKKYTATDLGYYSKGQQFSMFPSVQMSFVISRVAFPILSRYQVDKQALIKVFQKFIEASSMIIVFAMLLLTTMAPQVISFFLGESWNGIVPYLQIFCMTYMFDHINSLNQTLLNIEGRSDLWLRLALVNKSVSLCILLLAIPYGPIMICLSRLFHSQLELIINTYYTGKLYGVGYWSQIKLVLKYVIVALFSCVAVYGIKYVGFNDILTIVISGVIALFCYSLILWVLKNDMFVNVVMPVLRRIVREN